MKEVLKGVHLFKEECGGTVEVVWRKKDGTPVKNVTMEILKPRTPQEHLEDETTRLGKEEVTKNQNETRHTNTRPWR